VKRLLLIIYLFLLLYPDAYSQEVRLGINYERNLLPKLELKSKCQIRKHNNHPITFYSIVQAGLQYKITRKVSVSGSVRYTLSPDRNINWEFDDIYEKTRYAAEIKYKTRRYNNDIRISNRFRYQHLSTHSDEKKDYLKNKIVIDYKLTKAHNVYIAIEPYLRLGELKIQKCRIYIGDVFNISNHEFEVYFIVEGKTHNDVFSINHTLGIFYNFS